MELWSTHHRPQVWMVEDVAVVVHREAVPIHTKLGTNIGRKVKKGHLVWRNQLLNFCNRNVRSCHSQKFCNADLVSGGEEY